MNDVFVIYAIGPVHASVCSSLPIEEVTERLNREHPTGNSSAWKLSDAGMFADGTPMPAACNVLPESHTHYLFNC